MGDFVTEGLKKLYIDTDGFTTEDCRTYLQIVSGPPLGDKQSNAVNLSCEAITEYINEADAGKASAEALKKVVESHVSPEVRNALTSVDWKQALKARLPYLLEKLHREGYEVCDYDACIPAIVDIGKMGKHAVTASAALSEIANSTPHYHKAAMAHAYVSLEKVNLLLKGTVEEHIRSLADEIRKNNSYDSHSEDKAKQAAVFASYPEYTETVVKYFSPLLSDKARFMHAVTAIAGGGERVSYLVLQIMINVPGDEHFANSEGDDFAHLLENIIGSKAVKPIRLSKGYKCSCW